MDISYKNIGIIGFGKSGQNISKLLKAKGAKIFISNDKPLSKEQLKIIADYNINYEIGHSDRLLQNDVIVISPGVDSSLKIVQEAKKIKIPVLSEIEIASRFLKNKIIAITGTNGKSTTAYLTYQLLKLNGKHALLGGNISPGKTLSEIVISEPPKDSIIVVEISSFQIENISKFSPNIGIITTISEDHLDRYNDFESYLNTKLKLLKNIKNDGFKILNYDNPYMKNYKDDNTLFVSLKEEVNGGYVKDQNIILQYGKERKSFDYKDFVLPGKHNLLNLTFALLATYLICDFKINFSEKSFAMLKGMEHRLEYVGTFNNKKVYNNSMCTNPQAFKTSIETFGKGQTIILGGKNKNINIDEIIQTIIEYAGFAIILGEVKNLIEEKLLKNGYKKFFLADSLEDAIKKSLEVKEDNGIVNFSPGFSSFDMFKNFMDRGNKFKEILKKYERTS